MKYPKALMKATDLHRMGVPKSVIRQAINEKQEFVRKANPMKENSVYLVDTESFDKWWLRKSKVMMQ